MDRSTNPKTLPLTDLPVELQKPIQSFLNPNKDTTRIKMSFATAKSNVTTSTWLITAKKVNREKDTVR